MRAAVVVWVCRVLANVLLAEVGEVAIFVEQSIVLANISSAAYFRTTKGRTYSIYTLQVAHRPEPRVALYPVCLVHPTLCLVHEGGDVGVGALSAAVEVLAGPEAET